MNVHLQYVREFRSAFSLPQSDHGTHGHLSDMDIVMRQAWLMEAGSNTLHAIRKGDMAEILARLVGLAYCALGAIAVLGEDVLERPVIWRHDGSVLSVLRLLSDQINRCTSGKALDYSGVYCACAHLASSFLNADFDKAVRMFHAGHMESCRRGKVDFDRDGESSQNRNPDLSECLYE
ncbi:MAG: nucleoside triphosphate pyrophosphohydrolase family protein [Gammaproteobacteria bacterium]